MAIYKSILSYLASCLLAIMIAGMGYVIYGSVEIYTPIGEYGFAIGLTLLGMWIYRQLMYLVFVQSLHVEDRILHRLQHVAYISVLCLIILTWIAVATGAFVLYF